MWISKKRLRNLEKRVEELEKTANSPINLERMKAAVKKSWGNYSKIMSN